MLSKRRVPGKWYKLCVLFLSNRFITKASGGASVCPAALLPISPLSALLACFVVNPFTASCDDFFTSQDIMTPFLCFFEHLVYIRSLYAVYNGYISVMCNMLVLN